MLVCIGLGEIILRLLRKHPMPTPPLRGLFVGQRSGHGEQLINHSIRRSAIVSRDDRLLVRYRGSSIAHHVEQRTYG